MEKTFELVGNNFQRKFFHALRELTRLSGTQILGPDSEQKIVPFKEFTTVVNLDKIELHSNYEYMPNFFFQWDTRQEQYRVYIYVSSMSHGKQNAGYPIFNIKNMLVAYGFIGVYQFIHRHRSNQK